MNRVRYWIGLMVSVALVGIFGNGQSAPVCQERVLKDDTTDPPVYFMYCDTEDCVPDASNPTQECAKGEKRYNTFYGLRWIRYCYCNTGANAVKDCCSVATLLSGPQGTGTGMVVTGDCFADNSHCPVGSCGIRSDGTGSCQ